MVQVTHRSAGQAAANRESAKGATQQKGLVPGLGASMSRNWTLVEVNGAPVALKPATLTEVSLLTQQTVAESGLVASGPEKNHTGIAIIGFMVFLRRVGDLGNAG